MFSQLQAAIDNLPNAAFKIVASHAFLRSLQLHRLAEAAIGNTSWAGLARNRRASMTASVEAAAADDEILSIAPAVEDKARRAGLATAIDTVDLIAPPISRFRFGIALNPVRHQRDPLWRRRG